MGKKEMFKKLPPTFILSTHFKDDELKQLRKDLESHGAPITDSIFQAELVITKLSQERRIKRDIQEITRSSSVATKSSTKELQIVKEKWARKCLEKGELVDYPFEDNTWRITNIVALPPVTPPKRQHTPEPAFAVPGTPASKRRTLSRSDSIKSDKASSQRRPSAVSAPSFESASSDDPASKHYHPPSQTSTVGSEAEEEELSNYMDVYSCRRRTPLVSRNEDFIKLLLEIKLARELALDRIGVRAYSSAIAALKAYPRKLSNSADIAKLPGCGSKIATLFKEYARTGTIAEYEHLKSSSEFQTLKLFWGVWGCGPHTARQWYFDRGWRSLDDVIDQGWDSISRVQQIGIKYYDEFNERKISRPEVEEIGKIVGDACQAVAPGTVYEICGGYRRGKSESGDVDIIISNPKPHATMNFCIGLVKVLEERGYITHTLTISTATSDREENPKISLKQRPPLGEPGGYGLDSLDKALVVFLLPEDSPFHTGIHRRVDLIIAPWRAWGTAIVGWTGGTTFERDVRLWAKKKKKLKFNSGGITDRVTGEAVQLIPPRDAGPVEAEKLVFQHLGLEYIPPTLRNTG